MRILVTGAAGMLGREVTAACHARDHEVVALAHAALDITDPAAVDRELSRYRPDAVVNCAAFTDVDGAEDDEAGAMRVNDEGAAQLAAAAAGIGAKVLYPSSDYVFDGTRAGALCRVRHALPAVGLRPHQAGGGDLGRGRQPASLHRPLLVAVRPRRGRTSSRRCCGSATSSRRCSWSPIRSVARPTRDTSARPARCWSRARSSGSTTSRAEGSARGTSSPRRSSTRPDVECRVMAGTTEMLARKAPRPAYSVLGSERPDPLVLPHWSRGLAAYLAERALEAAA